jgi:hypothetical protein
MNNTYLKNTIWNLEFLDHTRKVNLPKPALTQMGNKTAALENLKLLQAKLPNVGYKTSDEMKAVSVALLADKKTVSVLNLLTVDNELNSDYINPLGKFLKTKWKFDPDILADCIKCYVMSNRYIGDSCNVWDIQLLYLLLKTGHERLKDMLYTGRYSQETRNAIQGECGNPDSLEELENSIKKYYVLESLPEDFDIASETSRICGFPDILNQPGALDIFSFGKGYCSSIELCNNQNYSESAKIVGDTVKKLRESFENLDSDLDMMLQGYFAKASYARFDRKLLKGFLQNISGFSTDEISKAVATNACFLAVCTGNRYTELINRIYESEDGSDDLANIALMAIKEHKKSFLRLMEEQLDLFLKLPFNSILYYYRDKFWSLCNVNTLQKTDIETLLKRDKDEKYLYVRNNADLEYLNGTFTFGELAALILQPAWIRKIYSSLDSTMKVDEKLRRIRQLFHGGITGNNLSSEACEAAGRALSEESFERYCIRRHLEHSSKNDMFHLMVKEKENPEITRLADSAKTGMDVTIILRNLMKQELFDLDLEKFKKVFTDLDEDSKWLKEKLELPEGHEDSLMNFCLKGNASIVHDYYGSQDYNHKQQAENILLLAKAEIYGKLDDVKYQNFQSEIGFPVTDTLETVWRENLAITNGKIMTSEYTDFQSCMEIGVKPAQTCMHYKDGMYNECLLATFDANKKVVYVTENGEIIGRALMRLTKCSDSKKEASSLHFADVEKGDTVSDEKLILFLERCYKNGFSGKKGDRIFEALYELAKEKADKLGAELVLAQDYEHVALKNGFMRKSSYLYVSRSKNGNQYLDSLGGNCEKGGYYVSGNFFFAS